MNMRVVGWPLALALLGVTGLLSALLGDGLFDVLSWLCLAFMLATIAWYWARASR